MPFLELIGEACASFAVTNIDDFFVLTAFFAEASASKRLTATQITIGQYLGFTVVLTISMIGFGISQVVSPEPVGFLGFMPALLGISFFLDWLLPPADASAEDDYEESIRSSETAIVAAQGIIKVALMTLASGGDNISTYIPLFSQIRHASDLVVYIATYYVLIGVWCGVAWLVMHQQRILTLFERYADAVIPLLYVGLGVYIIIDSECYPWAVSKIEEAGPEAGDKAVGVMGAATAGFVVLAVGGLLWRKWVKHRQAGGVHLEGATTSSLEVDVDDESQT